MDFFLSFSMPRLYRQAGTLSIAWQFVYIILTTNDIRVMLANQQQVRQLYRLLEMHLLEVEETSVALDVQLVEYLGCLSTQVQPQLVIAVESTQNVLLHVAHDVCLAQVIQRNLAKPGKQPSD